MNSIAEILTSITPEADRLIAKLLEAMNKGREMKAQLEALVDQMFTSGILYREAVREFKKCWIIQVLEQTHGNQAKAARKLGWHRNTLSRTIEELDLMPLMRAKGWGKASDAARQTYKNGTSGGYKQRRIPPAKLPSNDLTPVFKGGIRVG